MKDLKLATSWIKMEINERNCESMEVSVRLALTKVLCWVVWTSSWNIHICLYECDQQVGIQPISFGKPFKPSTQTNYFQNAVQYFSAFMYEYVWMYLLFVPHFSNTCVSWHWDQELSKCIFTAWFWGSYHPMHKYQPQSRLFKLIIPFVDGLLYCRALPRLRQKAIKHT